jgi:hypothetical protein
MMAELVLLLMVGLQSNSINIFIYLGVGNINGARLVHIVVIVIIVINEKIVQVIVSGKEQPLELFAALLGDDLGLDDGDDVHLLLAAVVELPRRRGHWGPGIPSGIRVLWRESWRRS